MRVAGVGSAMGGALAIEGGSFQIHNSTLRQNAAIAGTGYFTQNPGPALGGGLFSSGSMGVMDGGMVVSNSSRVMSSGPASAQGGGLYNSGTLVLTNTLMKGNNVMGGGGGARNRASREVMPMAERS